MAPSSDEAPSWHALVIGGCGFLGHHIVARLLQLPDFSVVAVLDLRTEKNRQPGAIYFDADLTSPDQVSSVLDKVKPHVVFHTASPPPITSNLPLYLRVNVGGTRNLLSCSKQAKVHAFVYTSSASVIHDGISDLVEADDTARVLYVPEQREVYAHTKALAEDLVIASNVNTAAERFLTVSLRPAGIFGEGDFLNVARLVELGRSGKSRMQMGNGDNLFDYTYVGNVVDAQMLAANKLLRNNGDTGAGRVDGETFLITNDEHILFWDYVRRISAAGGFPVLAHEIKKIPRWAGLVLAFFAEWLVWISSFGTKTSTLSRTGIRYSTLTRTYNIQKAKARLGYKPKVGMQDGIDRAVSWYLQSQGANKKTL